MIIKKFIILVTITSLLIAPSCSKKPEKAASEEIINGITHVHNTAQPMHPQRTVTFAQDLSIGGKGYDMLFRPQIFTVDQNGIIYIADYLDQSIKVFDRNGEYIRSMGKKGKGPGEFIRLGRLAVLPDGRLLAMDPEARRITLFSPDGTYMESHQWTQRPGRLLYATNSSCLLTVYKFGEENPMENRRLFVKEFDFQGKEISSFGEFKVEKSKAHTIKHGKIITSFALYPPYSPRSVFTGDPVRQYLYHCLNDKYRIEIYDNSGKIIRRFDRPYEPIPFTKKDAQEFYSRYDSRAAGRLKKAVRGLSLPSVKTITSWMLVDDSGNLWVKTHEKREEEAQVFTAYDIFNHEGYYKAKIWITLEPELFVNGKMYLMHTDEETGYRLLKRYQVNWNE